MAKQEKYTDIRIEAREVGFDEDTEESTYEFALCYTNLNSQPTRMVLDAEDEPSAKLEAAVLCEIDESYFDGDDKFQWD